MLLSDCLCGTFKIVLKLFKGGCKSWTSFCFGTVQRRHYGCGGCSIDLHGLLLMETEVLLIFRRGRVATTAGKEKRAVARKPLPSPLSAKQGKTVAEVYLLFLALF